MADVEALAAAGAPMVERDVRVDVQDNACRGVYNMRYPRGWVSFLTYCEESPFVIDEPDEGAEEMDSEDGEWYCGEQEGCRWFGGGRASAAFRIPSPLDPDWAFLASVRVAIDANMRENGWEGLDGISEFGRGRWPTQRKVQESGGECMAGEGEKARILTMNMGRKPTAISIEGWSWAGVAGIWRQVVPCSTLG